MPAAAYRGVHLPAPQQGDRAEGRYMAHFSADGHPGLPQPLQRQGVHLLRPEFRRAGFICKRPRRFNQLLQRHPRFQEIFDPGIRKRSRPIHCRRVRQGPMVADIGAEQGDPFSMQSAIPEKMGFEVQQRGLRCQGVQLLWGKTAAAFPPAGTRLAGLPQQRPKKAVIRIDAGDDLF